MVSGCPCFIDHMNCSCLEYHKHVGLFRLGMSQRIGNRRGIGGESEGRRREMMLALTSDEGLEFVADGVDVWQCIALGSWL